MFNTGTANDWKIVHVNDAVDFWWLVLASQNSFKLWSVNGQAFSGVSDTHLDPSK